MPRLSTWIKPASVLLAFAAWFAAPQRGMAQSKLSKALEIQIDTKPLHTPVKIREALQLISDKLATLPNPVELPLLIDTGEFKRENPDIYTTTDDWYDTLVIFPPVPSRMTVAAALRFILNNVPSRNATYAVMSDYVLVTTYSATSPERKLQQKVRGTFEKQPLHATLRELSEMAGTTIVVDNRAAEKAKTVVSASFLNEIDLASALRVLTEMAELKVIVLDGAIYVTTAEHVATLRKEHADKTKILIDTKLLIDKVKPASSVPAAVSGFTGSFLLPVDPLFDQFWPYSPPRPVGTSAGGPVALPVSIYTFRPARIWLP